MTDSDDEAPATELLVVGLVGEDHTSGSSLHFNRERTQGVLVVSAETRIENRKWHNLCTWLLDWCASVYACPPLIVGVDLCMSGLVRENESVHVCACVFAGGGVGCGRGSKNH